MNPLRIVVIETSARQGEVALAEEAGVFARATLPESRRHARDLAPALQSLLRAADWKPASIGAIFVGVGPGSYTGVRVGLMTAKTLAYATGAGVIGVDATAALAGLAPSSVTRVSVVVDAQQGKVYVGEFTREAAGAALRAAGPLVIRSAADWARTLTPGAWATGPTIDRLAPMIPEGCAIAPPEARIPTADADFAVAWPRWLAGERDDPWALEPLYLRPSAAELMWDERHPIVSDRRTTTEASEDRRES